MKMRIAVILTIVLVLAAIPAFAEKSIFQIISDSIEEASPKGVKSPPTKAVKKTRDTAKTLKEAFDRAEGFSLHGNKAELMRRRGIK